MFKPPMIFDSVTYSRCEDSNNIAGYKVVLNGKTMDVPIEPENRHYAEIKRQIDAGTLTPQEPE